MEARFPNKRKQQQLQRLRQKVDDARILLDREILQERVEKNRVTMRDAKIGVKIYPRIFDELRIDRICDKCGKLDRVRPDSPLCNTCSDKKEN